MKKIIFSCFVLFLLLFPVYYSLAKPNLEITNFKFGIMTQDSAGKLYVSNETAGIPNQDGIMYGFTYDYALRSNTAVRETVRLQMPPSKKQAKQGNVVVVSDTAVQEPIGTWYFVIGIDDGDLPGKYTLIIEHDGEVFKTIDYTIE